MKVWKSCVIAEVSSFLEYTENTVGVVVILKYDPRMLVFALTAGAHRNLRLRFCHDLSIPIRKYLGITINQTSLLIHMLDSTKKRKSHARESEILAWSPCKMSGWTVLSDTDWLCCPCGWFQGYARRRGNSTVRLYMTSLWGARIVQCDCKSECGGLTPRWDSWSWLVFGHIDHTIPRSAVLPLLRLIDNNNARKEKDKRWCQWQRWQRGVLLLYALSQIHQVQPPCRC